MLPDSYADRAMRRADAQAELLIGWTRVSIALVLMLFMSLIVQRSGEISFSNNPGLVQSVTIMLTYLFLGVLSILVVQAGALKPWMSWVFGLSDVLLVIGNLYVTARLQGTNPAVVLASPAAFFGVLVFVTQIFRFRLRLQVVMTLCLLAGMALLTLVASRTTLGPAEAEFLTDSYEMEPNIARFVIVSMIGGICILVVWRTSRMMRDIAAKGEQSRNTSRFLSTELRGDLSDRRLQQLREGRQVEVVVMFIDMRGFTALSEAIGAHATTKLLTDYRAHIVAISEAHGGSVDKFIGDGALVVFGLNDPIAVSAGNALAAAAALRTAIDAWSQERRDSGQDSVDTVIAVHAGSVVAGAIGGTDHLEFGVFGSAVNEASRIEGLAKQHNLQIAVSEPVFQAAKASTAGWLDLGPMPLRGSAAPVRLFGKSDSDRG